MVNTGARSHSIAVLDTVSELRMVIQAASGGKSYDASKCLERLVLSEREADKIEDRLVSEICSGELSVEEREALIRLVRKVDYIANWAKEAALFAQLLVETDSKVLESTWRSVEKMASELVLTVKHLVKTMESLGSGRANTMRCIDEINDQETIVDSLYFQTMKDACLSDMEPKATMLVMEMINAIEMSADTCKSCGDAINILLNTRGA